MRFRPSHVVWAMVAAFAALLLALSLARFLTFHNETFDLAFYGRMAWGPYRGVFWDPIVGAHMLGLHVCLVVVPLGVASLIPGGVVPFLLAVQASAVAAAAVPLSQLAARRFGPWGALVGAAAWLLYPNIAHVATYEWHPGTLAVLPMAYALYALDRRAPRAFAWSIVGVLLCREDLGLSTGLLGLVALRADPANPLMKRVGTWTTIASFGFVAIFVFVLLPLLGPSTGSVQLHFGKWGHTLPSALVGMISDPSAVVSHLAAPQRLGYLPRLLAPLAFLPLLSWRWLIPAVPIVGINLMSEWPTTTSLDSHYQTTLLPFLVAAGIDGASRLSKQVPPRAVAAGLVTCLAIAHAVAGGTPLAADFDRGSFTADDRSGAARATVQRIPDGESVQAPYALMAHLVERELISSAPPPDKNYAWVVLDAWHRDRFRHREDLLRTHEEPNVRNWLAREDYGLVGVEPPYLILSRGADPRGLAEARGIFGDGDDDATGERLAECLWLTGAARDGDVLTLSLRASGPCGADLALRIGTGPRPARVDLLFDGFLSPAHLRAGDCVRSTHTLDPEEIEAFDAGELRVGLLRSSGARPAHEDPVAVYLSASAP